MDLDFVSVHKHAKKELGQYPAILTSHLVNDPHILSRSRKVGTDVDSATIYFDFIPKDYIVDNIMHVMICIIYKLNRKCSGCLWILSCNKNTSEAKSVNKIIIEKGHLLACANFEVSSFDTDTDTDMFIWSLIQVHRLFPNK